MAKLLSGQPTKLFFMEAIRARELRIILTVDNLEALIRFYRDGLSMTVSKEWHDPEGNGIILEAGRASLELIDRKHAERIDAIEVGRRVSGPVRLAINVGDQIDLAGQILVKEGAVPVAEIRQAPWSKVQRVEDPSGMQLTLFETSTLLGD